MNKSTMQTLIDKVIGKKGLIRVPSWWMRKVLMQMADWVQEGDDANSERIVKVKEEANGKISTLETNTNNKISTLEANTNSKISTLETNTNRKISTLEANTNSKISTLDSILVEIVDRAKLQHSLKMISARGGFVFVDGVLQTIPSNAKTIIPFINTFSFKGYLSGTSLVYNYISYIGFSATDTSMITDMSRMFSLCSKLTSLDFSGFNTSMVTSMHEMFNSCSSLTSLDLSSFNTSAVTRMGRMFNDCSKLTSLNLTSFDTSAVTTMEYMFNNCTSLTSLILGPNFFKTPNVTSIDFSYSTNWTNDTVVTSLVTNSYDRATAGLSTMTLTLSANTKAALTDEQKAAITAKGYTIA